LNRKGVLERIAIPPIQVQRADPYLRDLERRSGFEFFSDDGSAYVEPSV
jgi:hypothetical protein